MPRVGDIDTWCDPHTQLHYHKHALHEMIYQEGHSIEIPDFSSLNDPFPSCVTINKHTDCHLQNVLTGNWPKNGSQLLFFISGGGGDLYGGAIPHLILRWGQRGKAPPMLGDIDTWCDPHTCVGIALGGYVANTAASSN
eukprot:sb/3474381/